MGHALHWAVPIKGRNKRDGRGDTKRMHRPLLSLPADYTWRAIRGRHDAFELVLRGLHKVATAERLPDGRWLTTTKVCFAESARRQAIAASPRQARRWLQAWLRGADYGIQRARPDVTQFSHANAYFKQTSTPPNGDQPPCQPRTNP